ncbi:16S rRNA (guanine(527)-N(7))-methyltransferase RsmG [Skermanella mucosa]|uniref:16S rRNA (guanine(527)-N(7))-methyltransferase RsmG n=1 Tax=Skermanella mucosa TaxID=1789672 RepID=UPI00192B5B2F|nr:16S rRNA (guanine(527)-N(7))-methyltransferase RsmG [Skermanella mucosa]UEM21005.1 16S rRNA (guanine(527)-N(7))-methyltransferase RsmG [Skermanella mucosa]
MPASAPEDVLAGVSRETRDRLQVYADLLRKWQPAINLVGPRTLPHLWTRHFADSAQLHPLVPPGARTLVDFGSGAGFPGLVLAILGVPEVHLIESDQRKAAFLREVARATGAAATVHAVRLEQVEPFPADVVTARALAPLVDLLGFAAPFLAPGSICLFPKGQQAQDEVSIASKTWNITVDRIQSVTDSSASILRVSEVSRA